MSLLATCTLALHMECFNFRPHIEVTVHHHVNIERACQIDGASACAKHYKDRCEIWLPIPKRYGNYSIGDAMRHERLHCKGWDHDPDDHEGRGDWFPIKYPKGWTVSK